MNAWVITFNCGLKVKNWLCHWMVAGGHLTSPVAWPTSVVLRGHFGSGLNSLWLGQVSVSSFTVMNPVIHLVHKIVLKYRKCLRMSPMQFISCQNMEKKFFF